MDTFKPRRFGVIDSSIEVDFVNHSVNFSNPITFYSKKYTMLALAIMSMLLFLLFFGGISINFLSVSVCLVLSLSMVYIPISFQTPRMIGYIDRFLKLIRSPRMPHFYYVIENPYKFVVKITDGFNVVTTGECSNYRKKLKYNREESTLEMEFTKHSTGKVVIEAIQYT